MNETVQHDTSNQAACKFREMMNRATLGGKWMAAVWHVGDGESVSLNRTTFNFQRADFAAAIGVLAMDLVNEQVKAEDTKLPDSPLPRAYPVVGGTQQERIEDLLGRIAELESRIGPACPKSLEVGGVSCFEMPEVGPSLSIEKPEVSISIPSVIDDDGQEKPEDPHEKYVENLQKVGLDPDKLVDMGLRPGETR